MSDLLTTRLTLLDQPAHRHLIVGSQIGLEKEGLRVDPRGHLALTPHPPALGSALANPRITTDYSEALLEFITAPHRSHDAMLAAPVELTAALHSLAG